MSEEVIQETPKPKRRYQRRQNGNGEMLNISVRDLQTLMKELVSEMRKPDAETQKKLDDEAEQRKKLQQQAIELARAEEAARKARQDACNHRKTHPLTGEGGTRIKGQVHSDGLYHPICMWCQKEFTPRLPRPEDYMSGVGTSMA